MLDNVLWGLWLPNFVTCGFVSDHGFSRLLPDATLVVILLSRHWIAQDLVGCGQPTENVGGLLCLVLVYIWVMLLQSTAIN